VTLRLVQGNHAALGQQRPLGTADRTEPAALRAGLFLAQKLALLRGGHFQGPLGHPPRCGRGDFLHLCEIHVEARTLFPEGVLDDNFSPLLGQALYRLQFLSRQLTCGHRLPILDVTEIRCGEFPSTILHPVLYRAKGVLHSGLRAGRFLCGRGQIHTITIGRDCFIHSQVSAVG